jgi:hypothetical protein
MQDTVTRDATGTVINIGKWDLMIDRVPVTDTEGREIYDPVEGGGFVLRTRQIARNPMPEGATSQVEDVVVLPDSAVYAANDPRLPANAGG